ncbi:MAG: type II secretion system F family protein [Planctomycetota bacterium]|nr:MAG: type II secretion system F family protein [Planctomycetota bacterium]
MATFTYRARKLDGTAVQGSLPAENERAALTALDRMGLFPLELRSEDVAQQRPSALPEALGALRAFALRRRVGAETAARIARQLADLVRAGVPILQALDSVTEPPTEEAAVLWGAREGRDDRRARAVLRDVRRDVAQGASLADAIARRPELFPPASISVIRAGEEGGALDGALLRTADFAERELALERRLKAALAYPAVLSLLSLGAVVFLLTWVVPRFAAIYDDLGGALPLPTRILMATGDVLARWWWLGTLLLVACGMAIARALASEQGRRRRDELLLRLPLVRAVVAQASIARFARTLGTLLASGVDILRALEIGVQAAGNRVFCERLGEAVAPVREGAPLARPLAGTQLFPPQVVEMISVGQETGQLAEVLEQVGARADAEVDHALKIFVTALEPALIVCVAGVVFFVVLAALLPIFNLNTMIS